MKSFVNELYDYEFTGEVKIKESEDAKEIPTMVIDEEDECVDEKTQEKTERFSKPLSSYEIIDEEDIETIVV